jgi:hypothetical protein
MCPQHQQLMFPDQVEDNNTNINKTKKMLDEQYINPHSPALSCFKTVDTSCKNHNDLLKYETDESRTLADLKMKS